MGGKGFGSIEVTGFLLFGLGGKIGSFGILVPEAPGRGLGATPRYGFGREARLFGGDRHGIRSDPRDSTGRGSSPKFGGAKGGERRGYISGVGVTENRPRP